MAKPSAPPSFSIKVVLDRLAVLGLSKTELARRLGVSQDYVYRILNGRIAFPRARETLERIAAAIEVDPFVFPEYRERDELLSLSTRLVWERMKERGMSRDELFQAMGGGISRPYFNSIMRGDQPFPTNRAFIQLFALALELPPTVFQEFGHKPAPRWEDDERIELERRAFALFFDAMMAAYGFAPFPLALDLLAEEKVLAFFPAKHDYSVAVHTVLSRMGQLNMGYPELERIAGLPPERLRTLFVRAGADGDDGDGIARLRECLHLPVEPA